MSKSIVKKKSSIKAVKTFTSKDVHEFRQETQKISADFLIGYDDIVDDILTAFIARGHVLLIGLPGLAKTLMVKVLSKIWGLDFSRIQFTPDLLPSDITGTEILQEKPSKNGKMERELVFRKGPLFANLVLADEINRTPPKTQSALLQSMEEGQITIGNETFELPNPFMVMATQNPIELEGTYPLPEAQLDRFLMSINFRYPTASSEAKIAMLNPKEQKKSSSIKPIASTQLVNKWRDQVYDILVPNSVLDGIVESIRNTRPSAGFEFAQRFGEYGAGPRATQFLVRASQAKALLLGETTITEDIVKSVFHHVLRHRVLLNYVALAEKITVDEYLDKCLVL